MQKRKKKASETVASAADRLPAIIANTRKASESLDVQGIPTGILQLDRDVYRVGGAPRGRIVEVMGPESGGKSTLVLQHIAHAQTLSKDRYCAWFDHEDCFTPDWSKKLGVDNSRLLLPDFDHMEDAFDQAKEMIKTELFDYLAFDSVAAMRPRLKFEKETAHEHIDRNQQTNSARAAALSDFLEAVVSKAGDRKRLQDSGTTLIFVNQIRNKMGAGKYENPETTPGGSALKFFASVRLRVSIVKIEKETAKTKVRIRAIKNKVAPPFGFCEAQLDYLRGFEDSNREILEMAVERGMITKKGNWYTSDTLFDGRINGITAFGEFIEQYPEVKKAILTTEE